MLAARENPREGQCRRRRARSPSDQSARSRRMPRKSLDAPEDLPKESPRQLAFGELQGESGGGVPVLVEKSKGAFFRLVKSTSRPPWQAATGGTRHGEEYQQVGRSA